MKALNNKEVIIGYVKFSICLVLLIILTQLFIFTFLKTSESEISEIKAKTGNSEEIFREQAQLCDEFDDFFKRYHAFDLSDNVNSELLMRSIVSRKLEIDKKIEKFNDKDVKTHAFLLSKIDNLLKVRDSISTMRAEENRIKEEAVLCNGDLLKLYRNKKINNHLNR
ncbi:MAG: hypothetical protein J5767_13255 [Paludibacteraceae bacterium]|nr:hypothetical protein [Paludibacteraceae bacterium]